MRAAANRQHRRRQAVPVYPAAVTRCYVQGGSGERRVDRFDLTAAEGLPVRAPDDDGGSRMTRGARALRGASAVAWRVLRSVASARPCRATVRGGFGRQRPCGWTRAAVWPGVVMAVAG